MRGQPRIFIGSNSAEKSQESAMFRKSITYFFWLSVVASLTNSFTLKNDIIGDVFFILIPVLLAADLGLKFLWKQKPREAETGGDGNSEKENLFAEVPLEQRPNFKEWSVQHHGRTIRVINWYSLRRLVGVAHLFIDGVEVDSSRTMRHSPKKPLLVSGNVKVFFSGAFSVKASVVDGEELIYQDDLSLADKIANKFLYFG
jgi:hypothetical protein